MSRHQGGKARGASKGARPAGRAIDAAIALHRAGDVRGAIAGYRRVLAADARSLDAHMNLGVALAGLGFRAEAIEHFRVAASLAPRSAVVRRDAGLTLAELGLLPEAAAALAESLAIDPTDDAAMRVHGWVLLEDGRREEAIAALRRAVAANPLDAAAQFDLFRALYHDASPRASLEPLLHAVVAAPDHLFARFFVGVLQAELGDASAAADHHARLHPDPKVFRGAIDSFAYTRARRTPSTRFFTTTRDTLLFALRNAEVDGLVVELGVRHGMSARWLGAATTGTVHGFDTFAGLPEVWHALPAGAYTAQGELPSVPPNVELHVGLFGETLPPFLAAHPGAPLRFANVDCDLYSSTATALAHLGDRVVPGTVLVFDEYLVNDRWREDEHKAFAEEVARRGWAYDYLAFNLYTGQAVVRLR
jgi:Flp pilus assembly protein TadD/predicted O-methyltransferase YrrM